MSLRTRLVAGLLALAAVGLLLLAGVTYAEQRHFLMSRVDDQAKQAALWTKRGGPGAGLGGYGQPGGLLPPAATGEDDDGDGRGPDERGPGGPAAGTWSIVRDTSGAQTTMCFSCYSTANKPKFPSNMKAGGPRTVE